MIRQYYQEGDDTVVVMEDGQEQHIPNCDTLKLANTLWNKPGEKYTLEEMEAFGFALKRPDVMLELSSNPDMLEAGMAIEEEIERQSPSETRRYLRPRRHSGRKQLPKGRPQEQYWGGQTKHRP